MSPRAYLPSTLHSLEKAETTRALLDTLDDPSSSEMLGLQECKPLLEDMLRNPVSMPGVKDNENELAATLIWRASMAAGIGTRAVMDNVAISLIERPKLLSKVNPVASDILSREPRFLIDAPPQQQNNLLALAGYRPDDFGSSLNIFKIIYNNNAVLPDPIAENLRQWRDNIPSTDQPSQKFKINDEIIYLGGPPRNERQTEIEGSGLRLIMSSFLADHASTPEDSDHAHSALNDYLGRGAFADFIGITNTLALFDDNFEIIKSKNTHLGHALGILEEKLFEIIPNIDLEKYNQEEMLQFANAAHGFLCNSKYRNELEPLKNRLHNHLEQSKKFIDTFQDPELPEQSSPVDSEAMDRIIKYTMHLEKLYDTLGLYDKQQGLSADEIAQKLIDEPLQPGHNFQIIAAIKQISKELNPSARQNLRQKYDSIIAVKLEELNPDQRFDFFITELEAFKELALFKSGQIFIDSCIDEVIDRAESDQLAGSQLASTARLMANALWQNIHYYTASDEIRRQTVAKIDRILNYLSGSEQWPGVSDNILYGLGGSINSIGALSLTLLLPNTKTRDITDKPVLYQILRQYHSELAK